MLFSFAVRDEMDLAAAVLTEALGLPHAVVVVLAAGAHEGRGPPARHRPPVTDWTIVLTGPARRTLARIPEKVATAVVEFLYGSLAADPHRVGKELKLSLAGLHSARRGDYRVIYRIAEADRRVEVVSIEHRSDAYRPQGP